VAAEPGIHPPGHLADQRGRPRTRERSLTWQAGLPCRVPERPIYGPQQVIVENVDENHKPDPGEIDAELAARGEEYGVFGGVARKK
jgi:hypothetical protein